MHFNSTFKTRSQRINHNNLVDSFDLLERERERERERANPRYIFSKYLNHNYLHISFFYTLPFYFLLFFPFSGITISCFTALLIYVIYNQHYVHSHAFIFGKTGKHINALISKPLGQSIIHGSYITYPEEFGRGVFSKIVSLTGTKQIAKLNKENIKHLNLSCMINALQV